MNNAQALHAFWSSFDWKAYDENSVPDDAVLPYITYDVVLDDFGHEVAMSASLWDRSTSWENVSLKNIEIANRIGRGGVLVHYDQGGFWLRKANPWAQRVGEDAEGDIKRILLNISVEYIE